jgi:hypothetical protein
VFGEVTVTRMAYRAPGGRNVYPADAELNLAEEKQSHGLRRPGAAGQRAVGAAVAAGLAGGLAYAPDLNPVEGIWSVLKRGVLANLAVASFGHLVQVIRHGLKKIQYRPGVIEGCLAGTGLALEPDETPADIMN